MYIEAVTDEPVPRVVRRIAEAPDVGRARP
jgi:hypothetical protein